MSGNENHIGSVRIAVLAEPGAGESVEARRQHLADAIGRAPEADLLVLPYLAAQPRIWDRIDRAGASRNAERPPSPSLAAVQQAAQTRRLPLLASTYEALGEGVFYAMAEALDADGDVLCRHRQWHALNLPGVHERLYFQPGSGTEIPVFTLGSLRFGVMLGGDLWVPEMARLLRFAGAETLLALTALPDQHLGQARTLAAARSTENGVPVILANRGNAPALVVDGEVRELDRLGGPWFVVALDTQAIRARMRRDDPLWMRRPRLYGPLTRRWEEILPWRS